MKSNGWNLVKFNQKDIPDFSSTKGEDTQNIEDWFGSWSGLSSNEAKGDFLKSDIASCFYFC
jgi:hypothetical protein